MTRDDARLRRMLEEELAALTTELEHLAAQTYETNGSSNHMAEDATTAFDQASHLALRNQAEHRLRRVERALAKFDQGQYGYCENCGEPIDFARLKALPDARFCLECQRQRETSGGPSLGPRAFEQGSLRTPSQRKTRSRKTTPAI